MTAHTDSDIYEMSNRQLVALFTAVHVAASRGETTHEKVLLSLKYIRSLPYLERSILLDLVRRWPVPTKKQSPGARSVAPSLSAPGNERPTARGI
jgi:hypothetical protein